MEATMNSITEAILNKPSQSNGDDDYDHKADDLCVDILHEILIKLPLKPIFKFKSVSKLWNSYISSPAFSKSFICSKQQGPSKLFQWTLLYRIYTPFDVFQDLSSAKPSRELTISACDFVRPASRGPPITIHRTHMYAAVSSSNGLLLCWFDGLRVYSVLNPLTAQWYDTPTFDFFCRSGLSGFVSRIDETSLKVINYKVVCLQPPCNCYVSNKNVDDLLYIYDSDSKIWIKSSIDLPQPIRLHNTPVCFNNILHWECTSGDIFAYDPYKPGSRLIKAHDEAKNAAISVLAVSNGKLRYLENNSAEFRLWVLEDYKEGRWELNYKFKYNCEGRYGRPIALDPFNPNVVIIFMHGPIGLEIPIGLELRIPKRLLFSYDVTNSTVLFSHSNLALGIYTPSRVYPFVIPVWPAIMDDSLCNASNLCI